MAVQTQIQARRGTAATWTSTNPTLAAGEMGFETDTGKFKIGTGSAAWTALGYAGGGQNTLSTYVYTATSGQTTFSGADSNGNTLSYTVGAIQVYLNGALLTPTSDFTASTGTSVVLVTGALTSDTLTVLALGSFTVSTDIAKSTLSTKGDILTATAASTPAVLAVGSDGSSIVADSSTSTGLRWQGSQVAGKNAVINGDFLINQRAFTSNTTAGAYNFDRWVQDNSGGSFTLTPQTFTPGAAPIAGYEGRTYLQGITATQSAAGDYAVISQRIEDVTRYAGTTVTISFFAKANTGTPKIGVSLQQVFGQGGSPSASVQTPAGAVTLSTSWARYSVTFAVPSISGKTLGTTVNTSYLSLNLWTSAGSTLATPASSIGIQNFTASVWGVQMEYGSVATYFTTATGTLQGELAACQRYYYRAVTNGTATTWFSSGFAFNTTRFLALVKLPVRMRVNPTSIETSGTAAEYRVLVGATIGTATAVPTLDTANWDNTLLNIDTTGLTAGQGGILGAATTNNAYLGFNAEL